MGQKLTVPEQGFISSQQAETWEHGLISGNGTIGANVMSRPLDETIIFSHKRLFLPIGKPLMPPDNSKRLFEIRRSIDKGLYEQATNLAYDLSGQEDFMYPDNFVPAFDLNINDVHGSASVWDCETGDIRPVCSSEAKNGSNIKLAFKPLEAFWLVFDPEKQVNIVNEKSERQYQMTISGTWKVTYEASVQPTMEFLSIPPSVFARGIEKPLEDWKNRGLGKFSGLLEYSKIINIQKVENQMFLDLGKVCHVAEV